jgi:hypothetical protein
VTTFMTFVSNCVSNFFQFRYIMTINIFGAASNSKISHDKFYIDQKFKTLSANLATKLNRAGDRMTGDLKLLLKDNMLRTFGVNDITAGKSVSLLLGDELNQIRYNFGRALEIDALHGLQINCPLGEVLRVGEASATFFNDVIMNDNSIKGLREPVYDQDAATKLFVDTKCVKNNVGYVPNLITNDRNKVGFSVKASSEFGLNLAYNVFSIIGVWLSEVKTNFWIQVECPEQVRIHKMALRGVSTGIIKNWRLQAANDDDNWQTLIEFYADSIDHSEVTTVEVDSYRKYSRFRIWINDIEGERGGLSLWQLFTVDSLV